jgi:DUF917 family protein
MFHPIVGDKDVREAVAIVVVSYASALPLTEANRAHAHVAKLSAPFVVEEHIRHAAELVRAAIRMEWRSAKDVPADVPIEVACYEQVQPSIVIVVKESSGGRPATSANARLSRNIGERSIAAVAVECFAHSP